MSQLRFHLSIGVHQLERWLENEKSIVDAQLVGDDAKLSAFHMYCATSSVDVKKYIKELAWGGRKHLSFSVVLEGEDDGLFEAHRHLQTLEGSRQIRW